jgi:hypothetical protein
MFPVQSKVLSLVVALHIRFGIVAPLNRVRRMPLLQKGPPRGESETKIKKNYLPAVPLRILEVAVHHKYYNFGSGEMLNYS